MADMQIPKSGMPGVPRHILAEQPGGEKVSQQEVKKEKIKDNLSDGDKFQKVAVSKTDEFSLAARRYASKEYQEAESLALEIKDPELVKASADKAVHEQIAIGGMLKSLDKEKALEELRKAVDLAVAARDKELEEAAWKAIADLNEPVGGGCGVNGGCKKS